MRIHPRKVDVKKLFESVWKNAGTFILAFLLAVAVWVVAVIVEDPNITGEFPDEIPIQISNLNDDFVVVNEIPKSVKINLRAPSSLWSLLTSEEYSIYAELDLQGKGTGEHLIAIDLKGIPFDRPVQVVSLKPESVSVQIEPIGIVDFDIQVKIIGELALGYQLDLLTLDPAWVTISGPVSLVNKVVEARVEVNVTGFRESLNGRFEIIPVNDAGLEVVGITLSPVEVFVNQNIVQSGGYRDVAVKVETSGNLASGYRLTNITVFPRTVTLFSNDPEVVAEIPGFVSTLPFDLSGAKDDLETRLALDLPDGVILVGEEQSVQVQIGIAAIETGITLTVSIEIIGLSPGLSAAVSPETVDVFLFGPLSVLGELALEDVRIFVNLTDLTEGAHLIIPQEEILPDDVVVDAIAPETIEVVISVREED